LGESIDSPHRLRLQPLHCSLASLRDVAEAEILFAGRSHLLQGVRRFEPLAEVGELFQPVDDRPRAFGVAPVENSALKRWETDAQQQAQVDVSRFGDDAVFQNSGRFEQHRQEQSIGDFFL
jgi:hypothetical protein